MQKPSKKAKKTAAGTNILPQKTKVLSSPPLLAEICLLYTGASSLCQITILFKIFREVLLVIIIVIVIPGKSNVNSKVALALGC